MSEKNEVLVVMSGERGSERVEAVCATQEQVDGLFKERGVKRGLNPHFPDEYWGRNDFNGGLDEWTVVSAPFREAPDHSWEVEMEEAEREELEAEDREREAAGESA